MSSDETKLPPANVVQLMAKRNDLGSLVAGIKALVYEHKGRISVTEAIGAIELAKLEILREQS